MYGISHLSHEKRGLNAFRVLAVFWEAPAELHFKMQVIHIDLVLGGGEESFGPEQTIEELITMAKKKAKKATKKKATKKAKKKK